VGTTVRKTAVVLAASVSLFMITALPAAAVAHKVGPDQYFTGVINGTDGNTVNPIPLQMACFGPLSPGETGHPLGGQTLAVHQLFPPTGASSLGETGDDTSIYVFFGAIPPGSADTAKAKSTTVSFTRYDKAKRLPTSLTLPCSGTETVWFVPVPVSPPSRSQAVTVQLEAQP
jgi:hypothetical protein